jgi:hypothetical protein
MTTQLARVVPLPCPFWPKPISHFGLSVLTTVPRIHLGSPVHPSWPLFHLVASRTTFPSRCGWAVA